MSSALWIGLAIGNSRLHWGLFQGTTLLQTWNTLHQDIDEVSSHSEWQDWQRYSPAFAACATPFPQLLIVSVVLAQTARWLAYPHVSTLQLLDIPLGNVYSTLGVDRALALWGGGTLYGWPLLLIDGGTALTLTGADHQGQFVGGAIVPGLAVQARSLHQATAALPEVELPEFLPPQWGKDTQTALQSGLIHYTVGGLLLMIQDWFIQYPDSKMILTGGDAERLLVYLQSLPVAHTSCFAWKEFLITDTALLLRSLAIFREHKL